MSCLKLKDVSRMLINSLCRRLGGQKELRRCFGLSSPSFDQQSYRMLIVGGGTGGISVANKFAEKLGQGKMAVLEPSERHYYQPMWTLVGGGLKKFDETFRSTASLIPKNCDWIKDKAKSFDPENNTVTTEKGNQIKYDYLVMAMGLQLNYDAIKGGLDAIENDPDVVSVYSSKYVEKVLPSVTRLKEGNVIFTFPSTPVKCPGAAQKICYVTEERLRQNGSRDKCHVMYNTSLPVIFPIPRYAAALDVLAANRKITVNKSRNLVEVRHKSKEAVFEIMESGGKTETMTYSLLHITPPMSTPRELWKSPLVDATNFVSVNKETLQHTKYKNVFSIGDCLNTPTPRTAAAVAAQLSVLSKNLALVMDGKDPSKTYNGYTSCPFVISKNEVILAEFGYDGKILETFPFDQRIPRKSMYYLTVNLIPNIYWTLMLKGRWHGPGFFRKMMRFGF